ncbi:MAG: YkgJ family cysteine cluster protein [Spirulinaceae cyanobacterium]
MKKAWRCVENCGACCYLNPQERPDLEDYLSSEELQLYLSMVGERGWCINFDHSTKKCQIYEQRPRFCRVQPENFQQMFGIELNEFNEFAIDCCHEHIEDIYGEDSEEMLRFDTNLSRG